MTFHDKQHGPTSLLIQRAGVDRFKFSGEEASVLQCPNAMTPAAPLLFDVVAAHTGLYEGDSLRLSLYVDENDRNGLVAKLTR